MPAISEDSGNEVLDRPAGMRFSGGSGSSGVASTGITGRSPEAIDPALRLEMAETVFAQVADVFSRQIDNTLSVIRGGIEVFARHEELPDTERLLARGLVSNTDRAFEFSRRLHEVVSAVRHLANEPADLAEVLASVVTEMRAQAPDGVRLAFRPSAGEWRTTLDPARFRRAVRELLTNAFEALGERGPASDPSVVIRLGESRAPGQALAFTITDSGAGMDPEVLRRCIEPFFTTRPQGDRPVRGLGLTIAHGFFRASGGDLAIDSRAGDGTRVTCVLPYQRWHWGRA